MVLLSHTAISLGSGYSQGDCRGLFSILAQGSDLSHWWKSGIWTLPICLFPQFILCAVRWCQGHRQQPEQCQCCFETGIYYILWKGRGTVTICQVSWLYCSQQVQVKVPIMLQSLTLALCLSLILIPKILNEEEVRRSNQTLNQPMIRYFLVSLIFSYL